MYTHRDSDETGHSITRVVSTLRLLLTLEHLRPNLLKELPTSAKLVRLMCVFLIGKNTFVYNIASMEIE